MRNQIFWLLFCPFIIHTQAYAMDDSHLKAPESPDQKSWLVIRIPYPALDSGWRDGRPDSGEWSPELLRSKIMTMLDTLLGSRIRGRITAKYETVGRPRSRSVTAETQADAAPALDRGTSARVLPLVYDDYAQTDPLEGIEILDSAASGAGTPPAGEPRQPFELPELEMVNIEPGPAAYTIVNNRYIIASASFLGGILAALSLKRK